MYKQSKQEQEKQKLYNIQEGMPGLGTLFFAKVVDIAIIIVPAVIVGINMSSSSQSFEIIFLIVGLLTAFVMFSIRIAMKGTSIGMLIFGYRFAYLHNGHQITKDDYLSLFFKKVEVDLMYHDWYESHEFLSSELFQTIAMKRMGIIRLYTSKCRECEQKYTKESTKFLSSQLDQENPESSILNVEHDTIFKDND